MKEDTSRVLKFAARAGRVLLQNGAEISRVEETLDIMAGHYGADEGNFFVLSNGIFTTGESYSHVEFIPIKGAQLDKVVEVNALSRDIVSKNLPLEEAEARLSSIEKKGGKPIWEQMIASILGCAAFCIVFGGGMADALAAAIADIVLYSFYIFVGARYMSKPMANIFGGLIGTAACIALYYLGVGHSLSNMIIGTVISLIPGVAFINALRDIINEDYLAGTIRLLDAVMLFFCIALGVCLAFLFEGWIFGSMTVIHGMVADSFTSMIPVQLFAAFLGTSAFASIFGVPDRYYVTSGLTGMLGWLVYLIIFRYASPLGVAGATFFAALVVALISRYFAVWRKCPNTVFLICGIFPLIPGGGVFWSAYNVVSENFNQALRSGFMAITVTVAIVMGLMIVADIYNIKKHF